MVTKETIKNSLEARWLMKIILSFCAAYVMCMLIIVLGKSEFDTNGFLFFSVFISLVFRWFNRTTKLICRLPQGLFYAFYLGLFACHFVSCISVYGFISIPGAL